MDLFIKAERIEERSRKLKSLLLSKKNLADPKSRNMISKLLNMQELTLNFMQEILNLNK